MAPRKENPKKKARNTKKATNNSKTTKVTKNKANVRTSRSGMKKSPDKRVLSHGYNLRCRSSSVLVVGENCACTEGDRRRLHRLHLHSPQCNSRRCQSCISVVTVSSEEDEILSLERTARWVQNVDVERGAYVEAQGDVPVQREGLEEHRVMRGRAGGSGGDSEPEPMLVDPPSQLELEVTGIQMETESVQMYPPKKAASPSEQFEIACAMNLSVDLAQDFRPLCVSTPEGRPISPRTIEVPGPSFIPFGDCPGLLPASVNPGTEKYTSFSEPRIGDSAGLPASSVNLAESFKFTLNPPRIGDPAGLPASSVNLAESFKFTLNPPRIGDSAGLSVDPEASQLFSFATPTIGGSASHPTTYTSPENSENLFDPLRIGDSSRLIPDEGPTQFLFGPSRRLWKSSSPLGASGNPVSYEFAVSGIRRFDAAITDQKCIASSSTIKEDERERKRKRSDNQVASSSSYPVPPVLFEPDN